MNRTTRRWVAPFSAALLVLLAAGPGGAHEGEVGVSEIHDLAAAASGSQVSVSGHAVFGGQHTVTVGEDPAGDNVGGAATAPVGLDFTGFTISQPDAGKPELVFTIKLAGLAGGGIPEAIQYNWDVMVNGGADNGGSNWSLKTMRSRASSTGNSDPYAAVFDCQPNPQTGGFTCAQLQTVAATYDAEESEIRMTVPAAAIEAEPGALIEAWGRATNPLWIGPSASGQLTLTNVFDTGSHDEYVVPTPTVRLALAPAGTAQEDVDFSKAATLGNDGNFSGSLTAPGPGSYDVWAQACFADNCGTASTSVTVT